MRAHMESNTDSVFSKPPSKNTRLARRHKDAFWPPSSHQRNKLLPSRPCSPSSDTHTQMGATSRRRSPTLGRKLLSFFRIPHQAGMFSSGSMDRVNSRPHVEMTP